MRVRPFTFPAASPPRFKNRGHPENCATVPTTRDRAFLNSGARFFASLRMIARSIKEVIPFMWLAGGGQPDFRTISDFRKNHLDQINEIFVQIVRVCREMGMVKTGHWSIDGTKVKANASKKNWVKREAIEKELEELRVKITEALAEAERVDRAEDAILGAANQSEALPKKIRKKKDRAAHLKRALRKLDEEPDRERVNKTDVDAPLMKCKGGGFAPNYNVGQLPVSCGREAGVQSRQAEEAGLRR